MIKIIFYKVFGLFFFLVVVLSINAQNKITVKASVDKNKILIGEPINLTVEADIPPKQTIHSFSIDTFPHFEFLEKQKVDTAISNNGTVLKQTIRITSFDSGHWVIPSFVFGKKISSDTIPVDVVFSDFDPKQDYHDIKEIIEVNPVTQTNWLWYIVGSALMLVLILVLLLRKKKPAKPITEPILDPYEEAMKQLDLVGENKLLPKDYYSRLVDIFRFYIFRRKGILSLQKTTDDLIVQLKTINLEQDQYLQLSQSLRLSDFVKFAKYVPMPEDNRTTYETIKSAIITIEKNETVSQTEGKK